MSEDSRDNKLFEFHDTRKQLVVFLSRPVLEEVFKLVQSSSGIAGLAEIRPDQVSQIELYEDRSQLKQSYPRKRRVAQVVSTIGFVLLQIAGLLIFAMGIISIVKLIWP